MWTKGRCTFDARKLVEKYIMEFIGTYLIFFFGGGAVCVAIYVDAYKDLTPIMWR
jgi:glycerol uptake facilitator-like aquaporin